MTTLSLRYKNVHIYVLVLLDSDKYLTIKITLSIPQFEKENAVDSLCICVKNIMFNLISTICLSSAFCSFYISVDQAPR